MNDDAVLLRHYVEDDSESAFTELVRRHVDLVYGAALRRTGGDPHRAAEVAQQVFTALARQARKLSRHAVLAAWLHTATRNAALNLMISEQRRKAREHAATLEPAAVSEETHDWERLRPVLDSAIDELSATDRTAVVLRFLERRAFAEIGAVLHVSEDAARIRTNRALDKLRAGLVRRGITSTVAALGAIIASQPLVSAPVGLATALASSSLATTGAGAGITSFIKTKIIISAAAVVVLLIGIFQIRAARDASIEAPSTPAVLRTATQTPATVPLSVSIGAMPTPEAMARVALALPLDNTSHVAFVIGTSGSMRDPTTRLLKPQILEQLWAILVAHSDVKYIQVLDSDGRFIAGSPAEWLPNNKETSETLRQSLAKYSIISRSNPLTGVERAILTLNEPTNSEMKMSVVVLGGEFADAKTSGLPQLDWVNPVGVKGRGGVVVNDATQLYMMNSDKGPEHVSINAVGFPSNSPEASARFNRVMQDITVQNGGVFVSAP